MPPKGSKKIDCPDCEGRGIISVGDVDTECATCNGSGKVYESGAEE